MAYAELQKAAKEAGLPANGTKEELLARLEEADATPSDGGDTGASEGETQGDEGDTGANTGEGEEGEGDNTPAPTPPAAPKAPVPDKEVEKEWRGDAAKMKAHLEKQPKVSVMIPLEQGVAPEVAEKVPFVVNLNGYRFSIKRGVFVEVPQQIAEVVKERLESEGKIGSEYRIDRDPAKQAALG